MFELILTPDYLKQKTILISGATGTIGTEIAQHFAKLGATVILLSRNLKKLEILAEEIVQESDIEPILYQMDLVLANPDDFSLLQQRIEERFGQLDGLIHCATHFRKLTPIEQYDVKDWHATMQINVNATFMLTQACLPLLKQSPAGKIIFSCSDQSTDPKAFWGAYAVSQQGIMAMMQILAQELEHSSVKVNAVNPGKVASRLYNKAFVDDNQKELLTAKEVLPTYTFLVGTASNTLQGICLRPKEVICAAYEEIKSHHESTVNP